MQKKKYKLLKIIITTIIAMALLLLLIFSKGIIKLQNKNKLNIGETDYNTAFSDEPNIPKISAGMIPVKFDGTNWIITTKEDSDWYNYAQGKPAYVMLNDGTYQSELILNMNGKKLASENVGVTVLGDPQTIMGSIYMWIPRFAVNNETQEIKYTKDEAQPGGKWTIPNMFTYTVSDTTKPDLSLSGIWLEKDIDTSYYTKITEMNKEESIYGFLANTRATQITTNDTTALQKYIANTVGISVPDDPQISDITNLNRIIIKTINASKHEPIKANITYNKEEQRIEIQVTYTSNGISKILNEYDEEMTLREENKIIYTDTGSVGLAKGTYYFTVIDNKGNKKELSITPNVDSLFKVAYISGTDNMDNTETYTKSSETKTTEENTLLNQIRAQDTGTTYNRAIKDSYGKTTAIAQSNRTSEDERMYVYDKYGLKGKYYAKKGTRVATNAYIYYSKSASQYGEMICSSYTVNPETGTIKLGKISNSTSIGTTLYFKPSGYIWDNKEFEIDGSTLYEDFSGDFCCGIVTKTEYHNKEFNKVYFDIYNMYVTYSYELKGEYISKVIAKDGTYKIGEPNGDRYWYERNSLAPKYTLYKYDSNLTLQSTYDVDTKTLTTVPIDISNKGTNKLKLTLNTSGSNYKTYISNDNTNWQEVTGISSNTPKELDVDGWDNLYIKIETNTSTINNIDLAYYKE